MAQTIKLKRSGTSGRLPTTSDLELGEVAINTYDGKMYIKKNVGGTESIVEIGSGGGSGLASSLLCMSTLQPRDKLHLAVLMGTQIRSPMIQALLQKFLYTLMVFFSTILQIILLRTVQV